MTNELAKRIFEAAVKQNIPVIIREKYSPTRRTPRQQTTGLEGDLSDLVAACIYAQPPTDSKIEYEVDGGFGFDPAGMKMVLF